MGGLLTPHGHNFDRISGHFVQLVSTAERGLPPYEHSRCVPRCSSHKRINSPSSPEPHTSLDPRLDMAGMKGTFAAIQPVSPNARFFKGEAVERRNLKIVVRVQNAFEPPSHSFNNSSRDIENQTLGKYRRLVVQMRCEGDEKAKGVESDGVQY